MRHWLYNLDCPLSPATVRACLIALLGTLLLMHFLAGLTHAALDTEHSRSIYAFFNLGTERNLPTVCAALLWAIAAWGCLRASSPTMAGGKRDYWWLLASLASFYIAVDELLMIHERVGVTITDRFISGVPVYVNWLAPYLLVLLVGIIAMLRFVMQLQPPVRHRIVLAAVIFITGAVGMEVVGNYIIVENRFGSLSRPLFQLAYTLEETLELVGVALFIMATRYQLQLREKR